MYALVNDVESYPEFLHWCAGARVLAREESAVVAELDVGLGGLKQSLTTRNTLEPPHKISICLLNGPFQRLDGSWTFTDAEHGCQVELSLEFEVSMSPLGFVLAGIFEEIARSQMDAFIKRARSVFA